MIIGLAREVEALGKIHGFAPYNGEALVPVPAYIVVRLLHTIHKIGVTIHLFSDVAQALELRVYVWTNGCTDLNRPNVAPFDGKKICALIPATARELGDFLKRAAANEFKDVPPIQEEPQDKPSPRRVMAPSGTR